VVVGLVVTSSVLTKHARLMFNLSASSISGSGNCSPLDARSFASPRTRSLGCIILLPMVLVFIFGGVRSKGHHYYSEWLFYKFDTELLKEHDAICWWWAV
jgi:hypothetical protein|tara:strand:+ start:867 stop:1166 length:300 start_codon:yes stop_codon:yes gene_type:complete